MQGLRFQKFGGRTFVGSKNLEVYTPKPQQELCSCLNPFPGSLLGPFHFFDLFVQLSPHALTLGVAHGQGCVLYCFTLNPKTLNPFGIPWAKFLHTPKPAMHSVLMNVVQPYSVNCCTPSGNISYGRPNILRCIRAFWGGFCVRVFNTFLILT